MRGRAVPVFVAHQSHAPAGTLYVTEAPTKALALCAAGHPAIGLGGVSTTLRKDALSNHVLNESWPAVVGLRIVIMFDANRQDKVEVAAAEGRLARALLTAGAAEVLVTSCPHGPNGEDWGPDDFVAACGRDALADLIACAVPADPFARLEMLKSKEDAREKKALLADLLSDLPFLLYLGNYGYGSLRSVSRMFAQYDLGPAFDRSLHDALGRLHDAYAPLRQRTPSRSMAPNRTTAVPTAKPVFTTISEAGALEIVCQKIISAGITAVDVTATGDDPLVHRLCLLQLGLPDGSLWVIDVDRCRDLSSLVDALAQVEVVAHEAQPKLKWLKHHLAVEPRAVFCTKIAALLLEGGPKARTSANPLRVVRLDKTPDAFSLAWTLDRYLDVHQSVNPVPPWWRRKSDTSMALAASQVQHLLGLRDQLEDALINDHLDGVMFKLEMPALPALVDMELVGFPVHLGKWRRVAGTLRQREGGHPSSVAFLSNHYPNILRYARAHRDGRVRPRFDPLGTVTGRVQAREPALQSMPKFVAGVDVRACFSPPPGHVFVVADLSQAELRILAEVTKCRVLVSILNEGVDLHVAAAARLLCKSVAEVTPGDRNKTKAVSFGIIYGATPAGLVRHAREKFGLELRESEAADFIERYLRAFPGVRRWRDKLMANPPRSIRSLSGRIRYFPDPAADINALINFPIQAGCADVMKAVLANLHSALRDTNAQAVNIVFDEVIVESIAAQAESVKQIVQDAFVAGMHKYVSSVPVEVNVSIRPSWSSGER